jgi:hypothetical protein
MEKPTLAFLIKNRLVKGQPEGETTRVWNDILHLYFKTDDGYTTGPEMTFGAGRADLFTAHIVLDARAEEKTFLIIECKSPGKETQDGVWEEGVRQLSGYIANIKPSKRRKYAAIAIGKTVRFFEWVGKRLVDFRGDGTIYYIDRQCQTVTERLAYFRDHH